MHQTLQWAFWASLVPVIFFQAETWMTIWAIRKAQNVQRQYAQKNLRAPLVDAVITDYFNASIRNLLGLCASLILMLALLMALIIGR